MYLRTTQRRNKNGSTVQYYQLAENVWDPQRGCSVAKVIYNFGRADQVDPQSLQRLAKSIVRLFPDAATPPPEAPELLLRQSWTYGGVYVLAHLWQELGVPQLLAQCLRAKGKTQPLEAALFVMVANRALAPSSKRCCWDQWLAHEVFLPQAAGVQLHHLYSAMDLLEAHKESIEKELYFRMADLMNADVDLVFYDTTSLHCEVDEEDEVPLTHQERRYEPLRKRGYAKNGRSDAPQLVVGLAVTREGLPVRSWVFSGQTADVTTVEQVKQDLRGWRLGRCVFVGDAAMNSEANRRHLSLGGGKYILASRMRAGDEVSTQVLTRPGRYKTVADNLRVKEVFVGEGERRRRYVLCHNPLEEQRQRAHRDKLLQALEAELASLQEPDAAGAHSKRTCDLRTSARFGRYLRQRTDGSLCIDRAAVAEAEHYDGKWVVTSNDDTLSAEDLALGYKQLLRVEECWRTLKSSLRLRPVYHWRPWRIQAHVSLSVLALLLERIVELRTQDTWRNVSAQLQRLQVVEYERAGARIRQTTEPRPELLALLTKLRVPPPPRLHAVEPASPSVATAMDDPRIADT